MKIHYPRYLCFAVPGCVTLAYLVLLGINGVSDETWKRTFPLSLLLLFPFVIAYAGGVLLPVVAMVWGLISIFLRFEGERPIKAGIILLLISFISVCVFISARDSLTNLPIPAPNAP
jgi:hypothetical protein